MTVFRYKADFGKTAMDYATHRAGFPIRFFEFLHERYQIGVAGQHLLDLGTGTGTLARGFARAGCQVTALDPDRSMLDQAVRLAGAAGLEIAFHTGSAEDIPCDDAAFDVVTAGQCWHWFDASRALAEIGRVLKPDGSVVIAHFDWLSLSGNVVEATEALIMRHSPDWPMDGGTGLYPQWMMQLGAAGFRNLQTFSFDVDQPYSHEDWRGRIRASAGIGGTLSPQAVDAFDRELAALLKRDFPDTPLVIPHRCWALIGQPPLDNAAMQH